ncbi:hypothetical protein CEXT_184721 [Caerostris extrusa]|uniref:Uncharacterized protein n=1 Tax=Caerostris extrusa TaxID=172846 RepID=A0AAV4NFR1_CAEEX|nr:hypothetical protein CEXT_184721 [Caerostris extrusa]
MAVNKLWAIHNYWLLADYGLFTAGTFRKKPGAALAFKKATEKCRLSSLALLLVIFDAYPSTIKSRVSLPVPNAGLNNASF